MFSSRGILPLMCRDPMPVNFLGQGCLGNVLNTVLPFQSRQFDISLPQ
jgi:hypothetical protein